MPEPRVLLDNLVLGESPRWHDGRLWLSDWGAHQLIAVDVQGNREVIMEVPDLPFCIDWLPDGSLLVVSGRKGLLLRREQDGALATHAVLRDLSAYPWNEIVVDGRGNIYVNSIGFNFPGGEFAPGVVALVTPNGQVRQVAGGVSFPNGMVVTSDNSTLVVAESYAGRLTAFDIAADGSLSNRRAWAEIPGSAPDGICLDSEGAIWYADVPNKCCVRVREGGEVLQTVQADRGCFACMLGGANNNTLFIVAAEWGGAAGMGNQARTGQVLAVEAPAPHAGSP